LIGTIIPIFLPIVLVTTAISLALFSFIIPTQAEIKITSITEKTEPFFPNISNDNDIVNENFTIYDGLGIKLKYSYPWMILTKSDKFTCHIIDLCLLYIGINQTNMPQIWILQDNFESQTIKKFCKCVTLEDYIIYFYRNMISQADNFSFINTTLTTLLGNRTAIQIEYEFSPADTNIHAITIFTRNANSFYQFIYYADHELFSKYFSNFQKIINTVEFT
jgi:hypothetical protein